jgi:polysaccharide biosynthesis transport protein
MLHTRIQPNGAFRPASPPAADSSLLQQLDLIELKAMARRQALVIIVAALVGLLAAVSYALLARPQYTAQATVLIGNRQLRAIQELSVLSTPAAEAALVDSEAEALRSERVLLSTIRTLNLTADPDFNGANDSAFDRAIRSAIRFANPVNWIGAPPPTDADPAYRLQRAVLARLGASVKVSRVGRSNVLLISVTVPGARRSAQIANGIAEAYLAEQLNARFEAAKRAGLWFQNRIEELREQSSAAQNAVERFRAENNLIAANGQLVSDQQLQQVTTELASAAADRFKRQARYDSLRAIISRGASDDLVTEALDNSIITNLRQRYSDVSKRHSEIASRLGPNHEQVQNLRRQMQEFERLIFEELRRIESTARNDLDVAVERERALTQSLESLKAVSTSSNAALVQLRQLEQEAASLKSLLQSFLQRYQETIQQESFPINDARLLSDATPPLMPSEPRQGLVAALGLVLGLGLGVGIGGLRELSDRAYRTPQQIEEDLGVPVFGSLPNLASGRQRPASHRGGRADERVDERTQESQIARHVIDNPFSSYAETLRAAKVATDLRFDRPGAKVIGIVSTLPREGKSAVSSNLAYLLAMQGSRALLIDGDLRRAGLSRLVAPDASTGLTEMLLGQARFEDVAMRDERMDFTVVPTVVRPDIFQSAELMSSSQFEALMTQARANYDYIVVDLPPMGPVTDAKAVARLIDAFLLVVEWGNVPSRMVRETLAKNDVVAEKIIGAVLNKVEARKMRLYQPYGLDYQQSKLFNQYFK